MGKIETVATEMESDATQDRIKQLTEAVQGLTGEVKRLQTNLDQMHKLQATLLQVTQQLMRWAENLESRDSDTSTNTSISPEQWFFS